MNKNRFFRTTLLPLGLCAMIVAMETACSSEKEKDSKFDQVLVINELMASNHTGLLSGAGKTSDWIEIKNVSDGDVSLKGYSLEYEKAVLDSAAMADAPKKAKKKKKKQDEAAAQDEQQDSIITWSFPDVKLKPGQCVVVFASKDEETSTEQEMHAGFKLSSVGGKLQLLKGKKIMSEVEYGYMLPDEAYRRLPDNSFEKSYQASPGFENDKQGYEGYNELIDNQRKDAAIKIWRVMAKAGNDAENWAEVKNVSSQAVDLSEYALTDNPKKPQKWVFPSVTLEPGATYKVQFMGKKAPEGDARKANFKIKEGIVILTHNGKFVDGLNASDSRPGTTMGRADGRKGFFYFKASGEGGQETQPFRFIAAKPTFTSAPGVYGDKKSLTLRVDGHGHKVRYSTGLSLPSASSQLFPDSLRVDSSTTLRAYAEGDTNTLPSAVVTASYLLGQKHDMAVLNITMNEADLFNFNSGIYVTGPNPGAEIPHRGANYWKPWEKRAHVEFFDGKEGFSEGCMVKIFGGFSRMLAKKSLTIKFNGVNGPSSITYDLFGHGKAEKYKSFVLRAGGQDANGLMGRDEFFTSLMAQNSPHLLVQDYRPVAVYVNTKYFGMFFIREKVNKSFVERHMNIKADSLIIMMSKYCERGDRSQYTSMINYFQSHTMKDKKDFDYAAQQIELESLIDFKLGEIYSQNTDIGNMRYFADKSAGCKWHWIYYDVDCAFREERSAASYLGIGDNAFANSMNRLVSLLLKSPQFRDLFLQRLSHHMHHTFEPKHATQVFDNLMASIDKEMELNGERWKGFLSYDSWKKYQKPFREKLQTRHKDMLNDLRTYLKVTPEENKKYFGDLGY